MEAWEKWNRVDLAARQPAQLWAPHHHALQQPCWLHGMTCQRTWMSHSRAWASTRPGTMGGGSTVTPPPRRPHALLAVARVRPASCRRAKPTGPPALQWASALLPLPSLLAAPRLPVGLPAPGGRRRLGATCSKDSPRRMAWLGRGCWDAPDSTPAAQRGCHRGQECWLPWSSHACT